MPVGFDQDLAAEISQPRFPEQFLHATGRKRNPPPGGFLPHRMCGEGRGVRLTSYAVEHRIDTGRKSILERLSAHSSPNCLQDSLPGGINRDDSVSRGSTALACAVRNRQTAAASAVPPAATAGERELPKITDRPVHEAGRVGPNGAVTGTGHRGRRHGAAARAGRCSRWPAATVTTATSCTSSWPAATWIGVCRPAPGVPLLALLADTLTPGTLRVLRLPAILATATGIVLAALPARVFGGNGGRRG